jgi:hypothetical protein
MSTMKSSRAGVVLLIVGVFVAAWGLVGLLQVRSHAYSGYRIGWGARVSHVDPGGPAEEAGLEAGDRIVGVGDAPVESLWFRPSFSGIGAGETQLLEVERGEERVSVEVVWEELPGGHMRSQVVESLVTLAFLGFGLWALIAAPTSAGMILGLFGLAYGVANFDGPLFGLPEGFVDFVQGNLSLFYTVLLCHFLMVFPRKKALLRRAVVSWLLYLPFAFYFVVGLAAGVLYPALGAEHTLAAAITDSLYMLLALVALIHSWVVISRAELRNLGFYWVPLGLAVAIGPFLLLGLVGMVIEGFVMPGSEYLPLLGCAIPAGLALGVVRGARSKEA